MVDSTRMVMAGPKQHQVQFERLHISQISMVVVAVS